MATTRFRPNGLLPRVDDEEFDWLSRPDFRGEADPIAASVRWMSDIAEQMHFVWPAMQNGVLVPPPAEHVLDFLVRQQISGDRVEVDAELMLHPDTGTVGVLSVLPPCDFCRRAGHVTDARYDALFDYAGANLCPEHYRTCGTGRLGVGEGQYLMRSDEVPPEVYEALDRALKYWEEWPAET